MPRFVRHSFPMAGTLFALFAFALLAISSLADSALGASPSTMLLGNRQVGSHESHLKPGQAEAFRFRTRASGIAGIVDVYTDGGSTARALTVGIYSDAGGHPGSLLSEGSPIVADGARVERGVDDALTAGLREDLLARRAQRRRNTSLPQPPTSVVPEQHEPPCPPSPTAGVVAPAPGPRSRALSDLRISARCQQLPLFEPARIRLPPSPVDPVAFTDSPAPGRNSGGGTSGGDLDYRKSPAF